MPTDETRRILKVFGVAVTAYEDAVDKGAPPDELAKAEAEVNTSNIGSTRRRTRPLSRANTAFLNSSETGWGDLFNRTISRLNAGAISWMLPTYV